MVNPEPVPHRSTDLPAQLSRRPVRDVEETITEAVRAKLSLLTPEQVCALLQVKVEWLRDQVQAGEFPVVKVGRLLRFRPAEVEAYLGGQWTPPELAVKALRRGRPRQR